MKVVLLGYMASGKSTVGKELASKNNVAFIDLDQEIEKQENLSIAEIFSEKGEIYFRKKETEVLKRLLQEDKNMVLSLGGGTPCYGNNMQLVNESNYTSFYIKLSIPVLVARLTNEKTTRPLVAQIGVADLPEFVGKHLFERNTFYQQAKHTITADSLTVAETVTQIEELV